MLNQRWRDRKHVFRKPTEQIQSAQYDVTEIPEVAAKAFILSHHYSNTYPAARFRFGLFKHGELQGVAVFSHPCNDRVLTNVFQGNPLDSVELGRFVLLDEVPGNGETWFLARCFERLRERVKGVVSFSDPVPRQSLAGEVVFPGHVGTIYQAFNGTYLGRGTARTLRLLPDGTVLSDRAIQKIRKKEQGWAYSAQQLVRWGAEPCGEDSVGWLATWLPRLTRTLRHPGNHKYAWRLDRRRATWKALPFPKQLVA